MKTPLFQTDFYQYPIENWKSKKEKLLEYINFDDMVRNPNQMFESDKHTNNSGYLKLFGETFNQELNFFKAEANLPQFALTKVWTVNYKKGDMHGPHNHAGSGYSGILYFNYDEDEHTPTHFVYPLNDPIHDQTMISKPSAFEGLMLIVPSNILHYTKPNYSDKNRTIIGFDIKFNF